MAKKAGRTDHVLSGFIALGTMCANNDYGRRRSLLEEALVIACDVGDKYAIAEAAIELGGISCKEGVYEKADQLAERGLALLRDVHQERSDHAAYGLLLRLQTFPPRRLLRPPHNNLLLLGMMRIYAFVHSETRGAWLNRLFQFPM